MQTIKTYESNAQMICESTFEKHIGEFMKQLKEKGYNISSILRGLRVAFDKIDASRVKVYKYVDDDVMKDVKKAFESKSSLIFGLVDGIIGIIYTPTYYRPEYISTEKLNNDKEFKWLDWDNRHKNPFYNSEVRNDKQSWKQFNAADEIWIVNVKGVLNTRSLTDERKQSMTGVWTNTPEFYAAWLKRNLIKYKALAAQMRAQKGDEFAKVMDKIEEWIETIMNVLRDFHKNIDKWNEYDVGYRVRQLNDDARWLLGELNSVIDYRRRMEEYKDNPTSAKKYAEYYEREIKEIKEKFDEIEKDYEKFKKEIEKFEK
jgi:hypothetical protein